MVLNKDSNIIDFIEKFVNYYKRLNLKCWKKKQPLLPPLFLSFFNFELLGKNFIPLFSVKNSSVIWVVLLLLQQNVPYLCTKSKHLDTVLQLMIAELCILRLKRWRLGCKVIRIKDSASRLSGRLSVKSRVIGWFFE